MKAIKSEILLKLHDQFEELKPNEMYSYLEIWNFMCEKGCIIDVQNQLGNWQVRARFLVFQAEADVNKHVSQMLCKNPETAIFHAINYIVVNNLFQYEKRRFREIEHLSEGSL